ncbi:MAG TPA: hypothetical protein VF581_08660 [Flavobacterium sp.]
MAAGILFVHDELLRQFEHALGSSLRSGRQQKDKGEQREQLQIIN